MLLYKRDCQEKSSVRREKWTMSDKSGMTRKKRNCRINKSNKNRTKVMKRTFQTWAERGRARDKSIFQEVRNIKIITRNTSTLEERKSEATKRLKRNMKIKKPLLKILFITFRVVLWFLLCAFVLFLSLTFISICAPSASRSTVLFIHGLVIVCLAHDDVCMETNLHELWMEMDAFTLAVTSVTVSLDTMPTQLLFSYDENNFTFSVQ